MDLLHEHLPAEHVRPKDWADIPASTPESTALSKHLKKLGFRFVGPVTLYSTWQAIGMIDDHLTTCWLVTEGHLPA